MKDFDSWFNQQRFVDEKTEEEDDKFSIQCSSCGRHEYVSLRAYENGDTGWYSDEDPQSWDSIWGLCGGGPGCCP